MVETWRWPKASYSALSMAAAEMPRRAAVSRSMTTCACRPLILLIAVHVRQLRNGLAAYLRACGAHCSRSCRSVALQRVLILRIAQASADVEVLHGLQEERGARHTRQLGPQAVDHLVGGRALALFERLQR